MLRSMRFWLNEGGVDELRTAAGLRDSAMSTNVFLTVTCSLLAWKIGRAAMISNLCFT
jgi:hypothetical protein